MIEMGRCSPVEVSDRHIQLCAAEGCDQEKQDPRYRSARKDCVVSDGYYWKHIFCKDHLRFPEEPREKTQHGDRVHIPQGLGKCTPDP